MNWYKIFYWFAVADKLSQILNVIAIVTVIGAAMSLIGYFISGGAAASELEKRGDKDRDYLAWNAWKNLYKSAFITLSIICVITSILWAATPSKQEALLIIAGGSVGTFITSDSSARALPSEVTLLLREKIKSEIEELKTPAVEDTLKNKTKEELIELLKKK